MRHHPEEVHLRILEKKFTQRVEDLQPGAWFKEELAKVWMSYKDFDGSLLLSRIHWAKESPRSVTIDEVGFL